MSETFRFKPSSFSLWFNELRPGMSFVSQGRTITEADVVHFSAMTGDRHPVHTDAEWAKQSEFGSRIANGLLVLSYAFGLLPLDPERVVAMRSISRAKFKRPVFLGDTITVQGKIVELTKLSAGTGLVQCLLSITNQDGRRTGMAHVELVWRSDCTSTIANASRAVPQ